MSAWEGGLRDGQVQGSRWCGVNARWASRFARIAVRSPVGDAPASWRAGLGLRESGWRKTVGKVASCLEGFSSKAVAGFRIGSSGGLFCGAVLRCSSGNLLPTNRLPPSNRVAQEPSVFRRQGDSGSRPQRFGSQTVRPPSLEGEQFARWKIVSGRGCPAAAIARGGAANKLIRGCWARRLPMACAAKSDGGRRRRQRAGAVDGVLPRARSEQERERQAWSWSMERSEIDGSLGEDRWEKAGLVLPCSE